MSWFGQQLLLWDQEALRYFETFEAIKSDESRSAVMQRLHSLE